MVLACDDDHHSGRLLQEGTCTAESGINISPSYTGELFTNTRGGISTNDATQYQALFELLLEFDFQKMQLPLPGKFVLAGQNTHGRGLTEDFVGDSLVLSDIDSFDNMTQVSEYWWEFTCLDDQVTLKLGKQDINNDFLYMDHAQYFIQSSFELSPSLVLPTYPAPAMAAAFSIQLTDSLNFKFGVWDALAEVGSFGVSGNDSIVIITELEYTYALMEGTLPGKLDLGYLYESPKELLGESFSAVQEYYLQLQQAIYREQPGNPEDEQGLSLFAGYYPRLFGSRVSIDAVGDSFVLGMIYTGLLPQRDADVFGTGFTYVELFQEGTNQEMVYELFYRAQLTERLSLQPDLQYIVTPSGIQRDALVIGTRFEVNW